MNTRPSFTSSSRAFVGWFLGVFLGAATLFVAASETLIRTRVQPYHLFYKYLDVFRASQSANAIFGDSHAAYGLTEHAGFVNLAWEGENLQSTFGKIRAYFEGRPAGRVIVQAAPHHLSFPYVRLYPDTTPQFRAYLDGGRRYALKTLDPVHRKELFRYWEILVTGGSFVPRYEMQADGSRPVRGDYGDRPLALRLMSAAREAPQLEPTNGFERTATAALYGEIVDYLKARGADVCLLTFPVASPLREELRKQPGFARAVAFYERLAADKGVRYVNDLFADVPDALFHDSHHLNREGARTFTQRAIARCFS